MAEFNAGIADALIETRTDPLDELARFAAERIGETYIGEQGFRIDRADLLTDDLLISRGDRLPGDCGREAKAGKLRLVGGNERFRIFREFRVGKVHFHVRAGIRFGACDCGGRKERPGGAKGNAASGIDGHMKIFNGQPVLTHAKRARDAG